MPVALLVLALVLGVAPVIGAQASPTVRGSGVAGVVTDFDDQRLVGASVVVESDTAAAISDRRGEFRVRGLPAGSRRFIVRRVGYQPVLFEVQVPPAAVVTVHVRLQRNAVSIGTMLIEGERHSLPLFREGFYERAGRHAGAWFFPPEEIVRRRITTVAALLNEVPGVRLDRSANSVIAYGRSVGTSPCPYNVWVDGALAGAGAANLDDLAPGAIVRAVEVYPSTATVPARFVRNNNLCGALVIWTKGVVREMF